MLTIRARDFAAVLEADIAATTEEMRRAAYEVAVRGEAAAVAKTNRLELVDRGTYKASWKSIRLPMGGEIRNDCPYAPVIEHGRRPGRPGPPLEPILAWVKRKFGGQIRTGLKNADRPQVFIKGRIKVLDTDFDAEALRVAHAVRRHLHDKGSPPHHVLTDLEPSLRRWFGQEIHRICRAKNGKG